MKDELIERMNSLSTNTAANILEIGALMLEAKQCLQKSDYDDFLQASHYMNKSACIRKWLRIGDAYIRLRTIAHRLPPQWTTIYKIAKLDPDKLGLLEQSKVLNPSVTAREIDEFLSAKNKHNSKKIKFILNFDLSVDADEVKRIYDLITKSLINSSSCELKLTEEAQELLNAATSDSYTYPLAA